MKLKADSVPHNQPLATTIACLLVVKPTGLSRDTSAYEKKYGTEAEREARREAQASARAKALAERESLERDEEKQLMEVIKASLSEVSN